MCRPREFRTRGLSPCMSLTSRLRRSRNCSRRECGGRDSNRIKTFSGFRCVSDGRVRAAAFRARIPSQPSRVAREIARDANAGEGIRTLEPLQERILSPPLLARLSHPRCRRAFSGPEQTPFGCGHGRAVDCNSRLQLSIATRQTTVLAFGQSMIRYSLPIDR